MARNAKAIKANISFSLESSPTLDSFGAGLPEIVERGLVTFPQLLPSQYFSQGLPSGSGYQPGGTEALANLDSYQSTAPPSRSIEQGTP